MGEGRNMGREDGGILQILASCYFWVSLFLVSALLFPIPIFLWLTTVLFDRRRYILHQFTCRWSDIILGINPYWKVSVEGREKIDPARVYVMVSNHQSGLDILVLFKLHRHFKWIAKKSLFAIPFIGWNMALNGYIAIERGRGRSKLQMMDKAAESIRAGNSVILFPEGTRSPDGALQSYKTGAFRLAIETQTPILPVVIKGTHRAIKKGGLLIHKNDQIKLFVLDPIPFSAFSHMDSKGLALMVHEKTRLELQSRQ
jgi:1-acyl-sn-glycerol-3-phosphate acyltransferase